ncbi:restriction endonuclease subunit S [Anaerotignum sp.]|uniref:restriction endonuclease subunit S n=1 Tax=Anaerotignum sp. TaxID=2039241 RepID=UPI0028AD36A9|nr:restriction endonuclease subunit S [Anaerotignum sp.]
MTKWEEKRINELGQVSRGRSRHRPRDDKSLYGGQYPFIQTGDVKAAEFYLNSYSQTYNEKGLAQSKLWNKGTLCITIAANIAETAILKMDACFPDSIVGFIPFEKESDVRFVKYSFDMLKKEMQLASLGATQDNFSVEKMLKFKFIVPDLPTQERIADILSAYNDLIENNTHRIELLEKAAQDLYKEWFVRFRFPNHENTKFVNGLPEGWEVKRLGEYCHVTDGTHDTPKPTDVGVPLVTGRCINSGFVDFNSAYLISEVDHEKIKKRSGLATGDILFSNIGTVGNTCLVDYSREYSVKNVIIFKPQDDIQSNYLYCLLTNSTSQEIFSAQTNGASQQFVGLTFMRRFKIMVPPKEILKSFSQIVNNLLDFKKQLNTKNQNLKKQRDLLLPRLMSGKLEV